jgi:hypothetical protein
MKPANALTTPASTATSNKNSTIITPAIAMPMSLKSGNPTSQNASEATTETTYWRTEFERVYVMAAARIRGEPVLARHRADTTRPLFVRGR